MSIDDITPEPNQLVNVELQSPHVLAAIGQSGALRISSGTFPEGCAVLSVYLPDGDYRTVLTSAIVNVVADINRHFGVGQD